MESLLRRGADIDGRDDDGRRPLHRALMVEMMMDGDLYTVH